MHKASSAFGLSLSLVERRQGGRVINRWDPFMDLYSELKTCIKFLYDGKNKARRQEYEKTLSEHNRETRVVSVPNTTRVGGAQIMMQGALRSLHALRLYGGINAKFEEKLPTASQWNQVAEFSGIMDPAFELCLTSQTDRPEESSEMILRLAMLKAHYGYMQAFDVVDTSQKWGAETPVQDLPTVKRARTQTVADRMKIE